MRFFVDAWEIKYLCLLKGTVWSQGEHFRDQEDTPMRSGALIQEETVEPATNARSHAATRARYRTWLGQATSG